MLPVKDLRIDFIHLTVGKFFKQMAVELAHEKNKGGWQKFMQTLHYIYKKKNPGGTKEI